MEKPTTPQPNIFSLLTPYKKLVMLLAALAVGASGLGLFLPKFISHAVDAYVHGTFDLSYFLFTFGGVTALIFIFTYLQNILQMYTSEKVAKDLRQTVAVKISQQNSAFIEKITPGKLLTNLTADVDSIKMFIGQGIPSIISSVIIIVGGSILLLSINWRLALAVLTIIPMIGVLFFLIFRKVGDLMKQAREVIDWLNKVINESILGSALIRVLYSQQLEFKKFIDANTKARTTGTQILKLFVTLIPAITFIANFAVLTILVLGGHFVITGSMSLGDFTAFNSYLFLLIFPILIIGIMSNFLSQATASYVRVLEVLNMKEETLGGSLKTSLQGNIEVKDITLSHGEKTVLKNISFSAPARSKTALIGPTAAGKTQLLYLLTDLLKPTSGSILFDGKNIDEYENEYLHRQIGFVFQDSIIFNLTLRENIAFGDTVNESDLNKAIETAELNDFIDSLPEKLETIISERGTSLSGGQKQRIMLARALALNPKILLLDDFTARVDSKTEQKILENLAIHYPDLTLISVTQKISSIEKYDNVILLMEGEILAQGTHQHLLETSPEYVQIYNSQQSTHHYE